ncbi:MAG: monovalent cation/H+ antiporter subunit D family protein, partial [Desulfofustis sp.]|nr:monovalent cation/H+ antiporter subunit D family protein [Desulfofustis sp.]
KEEKQTRFFACFAVAISSVMGIAFSANLFTLFIFYEVLTLSTYPLVTHSGTDKAKLGGRVYLGILLTTSILFLLLAIIGTWFVTGTLDFREGGLFDSSMLGAAAVLLPLYIFGIGKAAIMPFHRWLPAAMVAPTPVSALLHAVAVVKAGVFSVLKVCVYVFGLDTLRQLPTTEYLLYLAAATVLLASVVAMRQDNLKARLAYSTVSQLSYITLGALLATSAGVVGGAMHIAMHAFGKITLFFCAGAIMVAAHKTEISQMRGLGRQMPITMAAFFIGSLSIIGLPPTGGTWGKWFLMIGALDAGQGLIMAVLMISSLLNIAYLLPIPMRAFFPNDGVERPSGIKEAPLPSLVALSVTAAGCIVLFFYTEPLYRLASAILY